MESEGKERVKVYIENVSKVLHNIKFKIKNLNKKYKEILELAKRYLSDSEHYLYKGDLFTSLACISYAEGLLDTLRILKIIDFKWPQKPVPIKDKRVMVGGVFDILHPGHAYFLDKASKYGKLIVVVAKDCNVKKIKGRPPIIPEKQRLEMVKKLKSVDEAVLGKENFSVKDILKEFKPDYVILGPDQEFLHSLVIKASEELGLKVNIIKISEKAKYPLSSSREIIRKIIELYESGKLPKR